MSKNKRICFDASIQDSVIGIGLYNDNDNVKLHKSYNINLDYRESYKAEFVGLVTAMEYSYENNFKNPKLFTDNLKLAENGIPDYLIKKYGYAELYWIPREFNKVADKLSKVAKSTKKTLTNSTEITWDTIKNMKQKQKLRLLVLLAKSEFSKMLLDKFKRGITPEEIRKIKSLYRKEDYEFLYVYNMFINDIPKLNGSLIYIFDDFFRKNERRTPLKIQKIIKILENINNVKE